MDAAKIVIVLLTILTSTITYAEETKERILQKEVVVSASIEQVWHAWTTSEGMASFFAPESRSLFHDSTSDSYRHPAEHKPLALDPPSLHRARPLSRNPYKKNHTPNDNRAYLLSAKVCEYPLAILRQRERPSTYDL